MFVQNFQVCKTELVSCLPGVNRSVEPVFSVMTGVLREKKNPMRVDKN